MLTKINFNQAGTRDLRRDRPAVLAGNQGVATPKKRP
jgi:hypothetical protein